MSPALSFSPVELVNNLDAAAIRCRLDEMEREREALLVLLRAANARQRGKKETGPETTTHE